MKKIVITGGAGFIGSHVVDHFVKSYPHAKVIVLDKMTYAADVLNIMDHVQSKRIKLLVGDLCNLETCVKAVEHADLLVHVAAESHVDLSFGNSLTFTKTNVLGTHCLMEAALQAGVPKIIHVSTDEVYGEILEGAVTEDAVFAPTNPYSASKAGAEMVISGYRKAFNLPVITIRANNIFGIRQFPEKLIPKFMMLLMTGEKLTIHGTGENKRHFLAAEDFCQAIQILVDHGTIGESYNIGTSEEYKNIEVTHMICNAFGIKAEDVITHIEDRPFNDARYSIDWTKISNLGWSPKKSLKDEMPRIAQWYYENFARYYDAPAEPIITPHS